MRTKDDDDDNYVSNIRHGVDGQGSLQRQEQPVHTITPFNNLPARLFFFDDTEHRFDNRYAFALTDSKIHYRTEDRGKTWRSFEVPVPPALVARPMSFHSDSKKWGSILYQGTACNRQGWGAICHDEPYHTKEAFSDTPQLLLSETSRCQFAYSSKDFKHEAHSDLIYCVAFDTSSVDGSHALSSSRLFSSTDFFDKDRKVEDLGIGENAKGIIAFAIVSKYAVVALKDLSPSNDGEMLLYVTVDTNTWKNAYTIVESTTHSLAVDVVLQDKSSIGTLFVSNSNGTFFVESLKDTNRNDMGYVDYEKLYGVDGVGFANVVSNAKDVEGRGARKQLKTMITFDDGQMHLMGPRDTDLCSLPLHSVTTPHNYGRIFSSPAPGFAMGVGSIGESLLPYNESDTFISTDAGVTRQMVRRDTHKYEFGDKGSTVVVNDEDGTDNVRYSLDLGKSWQKYDIGIKFRARALMTLPDSTSQRFLLLGQVARKDQTKDTGRVVIIQLDFSGTRKRKCVEGDFEKWYVRTSKTECLMGHKHLPCPRD
ncbi:VPS10-like protein [Laccaria bicolor S238N-H82]|uniref:VPS10-like protein n=1 Tax=Laccaria bicolor (strain S238N-H82 / ATCC MYA-4686) TaxID=486041 RepID=B0DIY9_LACBS|nr:VPS10-like protein [Laccaria bicolor S238N-H82]EDR05426.1 VPS10-like protein [Laccaria bicolor S238N-H82]|eukprot:XP_001883984.1 VPS10-like protein [Laccaria bicolor S238N-H82]